MGNRRGSGRWHKLEEELLSNAMRGVVAVQQSGWGVVWSRSQGPLGGRGSRHISGPRAAPLPQLLELGGAAKLCCPPGQFL